MDITLNEAGRLLSEAQNIVITTHIMPDGDGLGAEIALYHYLKRLGKRVRVVNPDMVPDRYGFLDRSSCIEIINSEHLNQNEKFDLAVVVDTNEIRRLGKVWDYFNENAKEVLFFDHHPNLDSEFKALTSIKPKAKVLIDIRSSSIGELLYRLFHHSHDVLDPKNFAFRLSPEIALGLYVSIITDTNSFRYSRTTSLSHRIAAELIDFGIDPEQIYQEVYATKSTDHLRLFGEVLSKVNEVEGLKFNKTIAWVEITKDLRKKYKASSDDTQAIVNFLLVLKNAEILILFREEDDQKIKVSIKSRGAIKVNSIAQEFGGGGHEFASGFSTHGQLKDVRENLIKRILSEPSN